MMRPSYLVQPRQQAANPQRGMALIAVLWLVAALSLMVVGVSGVVRQETRMVAVAKDKVMAQAVGDAGVVLVLQQLAAQNLLETSRGRGGGMRLMTPAQDINVGRVVRSTETDFTLVECFDATTNQCRLSSYCSLQSALSEAMERFFAVLDKLTLADLMAPPTPSAGCFARTYTLNRMPGIPS